MSKRGRRPFKPTAAMRKKVEGWAACGMPREQIARALKQSPPTVDKHFAEELANGRAIKRAELIDMFWKNARKGNVAAQKALAAMLDRAPAFSAAAAVAGDMPASKVNRASKIGKKEQAKLDAAMPPDDQEWAELLGEHAVN